MRNNRNRLLILGAIVVAACGEGEPAFESDVPERVGEVDLEIGRLDGPPEYTFGMISGTVTAPNGEILVSDGQQEVIRVFDIDGAFLRSIGRDGEGPGEFRMPCCIAFGPTGLLWVRDGGNRRYVSFEMSAVSEVPGPTIRMSHASGGLFAPITFQTDSTLIDIGHKTGADGEFALWRTALSLQGRTTGTELVEEPSPETLGTKVRQQTVPGGMAQYYYPQPYGPSFLLAHGPGGAWASAVSSEYAVTLHMAGDTVEVHGPSVEGPPLSPREMERARERLQTYLERGGGKLSDYPEVPFKKPPLAGLNFDVTGRLWVELSVEEGQDRRADLYDFRGDLVERRVWPSRVSLRFPAWLGSETVLGITTDSLGVQRVARVRF